MKLKIIALALAAGIAASASAQTNIYNNPNNHKYLGLRLSYGLACPGDVNLGDGYKVDAYGNSSGFSAGVVYHLPVMYNFYFEPGAMLAYNTYSINKGVVGEFLPDGLATIAKDASVRMWKLRLPLQCGYHFDIMPDLSVSVFTGPEIIVGLKGKNHVTVDNDSDYAVSSGCYGGDGQLNRFDLGWRFGAQGTYYEHYTLSFSGVVGLCDQMRKSPKMHTNVFDITLGYNF